MEYQAKSGECQTVCCDGPGGPIALILTCSPSNKCEGFLPKEKTETGHCPSEEKGTCQCDKGDRLIQHMYMTPFVAVP